MAIAVSRSHLPTFPDLRRPFSRVLQLRQGLCSRTNCVVECNLVLCVKQLDRRRGCCRTKVQDRRPESSEWLVYTKYVGGDTEASSEVWLSVLDLKTATERKWWARVLFALSAFCAKCSDHAGHRNSASAANRLRS